MAYPNLQRTHRINDTHKIDQWAWGPGQQRFYPMYARGAEWHFYVDRNSSDAGSQWFVTQGGAEAFLRNNQHDNQLRRDARKAKQPVMLRRRA